jgi:hypothetical protein
MLPSSAMIFKRSTMGSFPTMSSSCEFEMECHCHAREQGHTPHARTKDTWPVGWNHSPPWAGTFPPRGPPDPARPPLAARQHRLPPPPPSQRPQQQQKTTMPWTLTRGCVCDVGPLSISKWWWKERLSPRAVHAELGVKVEPPAALELLPVGCTRQAHRVSPPRRTKRWH